MKDAGVKHGDRVFLKHHSEDLFQQPAQEVYRREGSSRGAGGCGGPTKIHRLDLVDQGG